MAEEATALEGLAARLLADAAAVRLGPARENVPRFGDWAYGWVQSYVTSYRLLARGLREVAVTVAEGEVPLVARLAQEMAVPIRDEFRDRVLAPALRDGGFQADLAHVGATLDTAWAAALRRHGVPDDHAAAAPLTPTLLAEAPSDPMGAIAEEGADSDTVFLRSMRPMAARLGAVVVRVSEAGSVIATGGAFGYALGGFPGTAMGMAGGIGASWALDWLLNRLDSSLNRSAFEAQALDAIGRAEQRLARDATAVAAAALQARLVLVAEGCPR